MTRFWGHQDNQFPPEDSSVGFDYNGSTIYPGDKLVEIDDDIFLYDELTVDDMIRILRLPVYAAQKEC